MTRLHNRITRLEQTHRPDVLEIRHIIIAPAGGDPLDSVVMQRQPDGTWNHRPITKNEAENHDAQEG